MTQNTRLTAARSRPIYYAASALTLLCGLRPLSLVAAVALALGRPGPRLLELRRSKAVFLVGSLMDVWMVKEVCLDRDYEGVAAPIQGGWTVVDIGAGIGEFAIDIAVRHPTCTIHAFEPTAETFALLDQNVRLNGASNVRTHAVAVTGVSGMARLDVSTADSVRHHVTAAEGVIGQTRQVTARSLADVLDELGGAQCDFLKIDCEGGEYALLLGANRPTLTRISRLCLEYHDGSWGTHGQLVDHLTAAGFQVALTPNKAWRELGFLYAWRDKERGQSPSTAPSAP